MSRIEILGPRSIVQEVLDSLREQGLVHLAEIPARCPNGTDETAPVTPFDEDPHILSERLFLQDLLSRTNELLAHMPGEPPRRSYLRPASVMAWLKTLLPVHLEQIKRLEADREALHRQRGNRLRQSRFIAAVLPLIRNFPELPDLELIGIEIDKPQDLGKIKTLLDGVLGEQFELQISTLEDGTTVALVALPRARAEELRKTLRDGHVPEFGDGGRSDLPVASQYQELVAEVERLDERMARLDEALDTLMKRWKPHYLALHEWLRDRLALSAASSMVVCTRMCFVVTGWVPTNHLQDLVARLHERFGPQVVIEEKALRAEDLDRIPVTLKNPAPFRPYELFTRLLPLPRYHSLDPTPFIAIFFPLMFGMILGDLGYALLLAVAGGTTLLAFRRRKGAWRDVSIIALSCSFYSAVFGIFYGECFGEWGAHLLGLHPLVFDRMRALVPMGLFALAVGTAHVLFGMILGAGAAFRHHQTREGAAKILGILLLTGLILLLVSYAAPAAQAVRRPVLFAIGIAIPLLIIFGGFLAPLEMLKSLGHIISYARIMAVGMTSVMLAYVANELGGAAGSVAAGIVIAALLHLFNLIMGIFAPTVHALRLHFVEFFSKFLESGAPPYDPLKK